MAIQKLYQKVNTNSTSSENVFNSNTPKRKGRGIPTWILH